MNNGSKRFVLENYLSAVFVKISADNGQINDFFYTSSNLHH